MNARPNLLSPDVLADPFPLYAELRRDRPVCQVDPGGLWAVARHDDVQYVLRNPDLFSSAGFRVATEQPWLPRNPISDSLLLQDPPAHGRLRGLVGNAFGPEALARLEERVRVIAAELADQLAITNKTDFQATFALPLPARVIAEILGVDPALHVHFKRWVLDMNAVALPGQSDARIAEIRASIEEMIAYMNQVIADRRRCPADDMISDLLVPNEDGDRMTDEEILSFLFIVLPAGFETTTNLLASAMRVLLRRPDLLARLRADPARIPAFVEEVLRHDGPSVGLLRLTTREVELGGVVLPAYSPVLCLLSSANRDERRFADADVFDLDRSDRKHLAFGHGIHACLGAALARMEARVGIAALLERFDAVEAAGPSDWVPSFLLRGPTVFPVRLRRAEIARAA
jgi:cytochrome P450